MMDQVRGEPHNEEDAMTKFIVNFEHELENGTESGIFGPFNRVSEAEECVLLLSNRSDAVSAVIQTVQTYSSYRPTTQEQAED